MVANVDDPQSDLDRRQSNTAALFQFDAKEKAEFTLMASRYQSALKGIRQSVQSVLAGKRQISDSDRAQLELLRSQRLNVVYSEASRFLGVLSPASATRINDAIAKVVLQR